MSFPSHIVLSLQSQWSFWGVLEVSSSAWVFFHKGWFSDFAGFSVRKWGGQCIGVHLWEDVPETKMRQLVLRPHWYPSTQSEWIHFALLPHDPVLRQNIFFTVTIKADQCTPVQYLCRTVKRILKIFFYTATIHNTNFSFHAEVPFLVSTMSPLAVWFLPVKVMPLKALIYSFEIIPLHTWKWLYWHKAPLSWDNQVHAKAGSNAFNNTSTVREPAITC